VRRPLAVLFAIWAAAACAADGNTAPAASAATESALAAAPQIAPAPVGPPIRILWAPARPQTLAVAVRVDPSVSAAVRLPALVPATAAQLKSVERQFMQHFTGDFGLTTTLQNLRDQKYSGSEEWMFTTNFAPGAFADHVREMITTRRENESRTFRPGEATLENAWVRPSNGVFGDASTIGLVEGTMSFTEDVRRGADLTAEPHTWRIRALSQGQLFILDGAEAPAQLAPLAPFDPATLDGELAAQVSTHLHDEEAGPQATPMALFKGTAYWDARKGALDWLQALAKRGSLTDRHFENVRAQVVAFRPTSYLGDGYIIVHLRGMLVETLNGARHTYPVDELVQFQRFSFAQAYWFAVDGQNDDGSWIAQGNYGTPEPVAHG
jgi:hypothetical protein